MATGEFDWHSDPIGRETLVTANYRNTQNVRRFLRTQCGSQFKFDRPLMQWIRDEKPKTMGDVADEWVKRNFR